MPSYHLPIYAREPSGIYYLHTSIRGKAFKRSLHTRDRHQATLIAIPIIQAIQSLKRAYRGIEPAMTIRKFEIDLQKQIFKTDGTPEDNTALLDALGKLATLPMPTLPTPPQKASNQATEPTEGTRPDITILELLEDYKLFKKLKPASVLKYEGVATEYFEFCRKKTLNKMLESDFLSYQKSLFQKGQALWTVQAKTTIISSLFDFAIKRRSYYYSNPVVDKKVMTKKDKLEASYDSFDLQEILKIYNTEDLKQHKTKDPDFYFVIMIEVLAGMRVNEITTLKKTQFFDYQNRLIIRINDSKTKSGIRKVSLPPDFSKELKAWIDKVKYPEDKIFKYREIEGKGAGNAVGKKFARILKKKGLTYRKYVFHSVRKFLNNYMRQAGVSLEMRSQIIGHQVFSYDGVDLSNNVNIDYYSKDYELETIIQTLEVHQNSILLNIGLT